jgi:hypothetical protein
MDDDFKVDGGAGTPMLKPGETTELFSEAIDRTPGPKRRWPTPSILVRRWGGIAWCHPRTEQRYDLFR